MKTNSLPTAVEAEKWVIGSMLLDQSTIPGVLAIVDVDDFADDANRVIFGEVVRQHQGRMQTDLGLVKKSLEDSGVLGRNSAAAMLAEIGTDVPTAAHAGHYAGIVREAADKRSLYLLATEAARGAVNGQSSAETLEQLQADLAVLSQRGEQGKRLSFAELRDQFPQLNPPVVEGLFREGETANIIASPKAGKSWLVYSLALSIITGKPWLDRFATTKGKVLLVDNELHPQTIANRIPKVARALGLFPEDYENDLEIWSLRGKLRSLEELEPEFMKLKAGYFKTIILDSKYRFAKAGTSENDNTSETQFYNQVDRIAEHTRAAIPMIHHASKGNQAGKSVTDTGSGAGAQSRAPDCHLVLREHETEGVVVLEAAVRSFAPVVPLALRWDFPLWEPDDEADTSQLKGLKTKSQERQAKNDKEGIDKIVAALMEGSATARALRQKTGMSRERLQRLLDQMTYEGHLTTNETTVNHNRCVEYSLAD